MTKFNIFNLFNYVYIQDAIVVTLYNSVTKFERIELVTANDIIFHGLFALFLKSVGGVAVGLIFGGLATFITKFTSNVRG